MGSHTVAQVDFELGAILLPQLSSAGITSVSRRAQPLSCLRVWAFVGCQHLLFQRTSFSFPAMWVCW